MAQATTSPAGRRAGARDEPGGDDLLSALTALLVHLKRRSGDPDSSARAYLLGHVERLAPVRATDLADHVALDLSTISRHLRGLEDAGLLARTPDPDDRRAALLSLTDEGRVALDHAVRTRTELLDSATAAWPPEDVAALTSLLARLAHDLETL